MTPAHPGEPPAPHELATTWNLDPLLLGALLVAAWIHHRGRTRSDRTRSERTRSERTRSDRRRADVWRAGCFAAGLVAVALALLSPLDALAGVLASAHMVQHLLLVLVAAPLLAWSSPSGVLLRGSLPVVAHAVSRWRSRLRLTGHHPLRQPGTVWLLHVTTLWGWHAAAAYDAALDHPLVHALEHTSFLVTGVLFWRLLVGPRAVRVFPGVGVLLVFTMALQSVLLSVLLTFAGTPWYSGYATTTQPWGLDPLADQQLAGAIMWVPAGLVYVGAALALLVGWLRDTQGDDVALTTPVSFGASGAPGSR